VFLNVFGVNTRRFGQVFWIGTAADRNDAKWMVLFELDQARELEERRVAADYEVDCLEFWALDDETSLKVSLMSAATVVDHRAMGDLVRQGTRLA